MIINKSDIINQINQKIESLTTSDIDYSVKKVISYISRSLYTGKRIEIRGFGTFLCTIIIPELHVIQKRENMWHWKREVMYTLSRAKNLGLE